VKRLGELTNFSGYGRQSGGAPGNAAWPRSRLGVPLLRRSVSGCWPHWSCWL